MLNDLIDSKVGLLDQLSTEDKDTVVASINEIESNLKSAIQNIAKLAEGSETISNKLGKAFQPKGLFTDNIDDLYNESDNGVYWCSTVNGATGTLPTTGYVWFFLTVEVPKAEVSKQTFFLWDTYTTFERMRVNDVWLPWRQIALTENLYNPGVITNPDFKINQRGQAKYIGANSNAPIYTVDRWSMYNNCDVTVIENGVHVDFKNKASSFGTYIENCKELIGKPLTISWQYSNSTNDYLALAVCGYNSSGTQIMNEWTYVRNLKKTVNSIPSDVEKLLIRFKINGGEAAAPSTASIDLNFVKAEVGYIATPFIPPNRAEELIKCQRYYYRLSSNTTQDDTYYMTLPLGMKMDNLVNGTFIVPLQLPVPMRVFPTIRYYDVTCYSPENDEWFTVVGVTASKDYSDKGNKLIALNFKVSGALPRGAVYCELSDSAEGSYIELDAEVY